VIRGGGRGESFPVAAVKVKSLNPLPEGGGAQPIMNDQETIIVVQNFNTRGLALTTDKTNLPLLISLFSQ
jgi:hypothetical protein